MDKETKEAIAGLVEELVDLMWDDDKSKCMISCNKPDCIPCGCQLCIDENKEYWLKKLEDIIKKE